MKYLNHIFLILFLGSTLLTASCENKTKEKDLQKTQHQINLKKKDANNADSIIVEVVRPKYITVDGEPLALHLECGPSNVRICINDKNVKINNEGYDEDKAIFFEGLMKINGTSICLKSEEHHMDDRNVWSNEQWEIQLEISNIKSVECADWFVGKLKIQSKISTITKFLNVYGEFGCVC